MSTFFCTACHNTGEVDQRGALDCTAPGCTAAADRAALNAHLAALGQLTDNDRAWEACRFGMALAQANNHEAMLQAAEAMREQARDHVRANVDTIRRNGHTANADLREALASSIHTLDAQALVASLTGATTTLAEQQAFDAAAKQALFPVSRRDNGELFYPITQRCWQVWQAAVRWQKNQREG